MFPILQLGPVAVQLPGLLLLIGTWLGVELVEREAPRHKLSARILANLIFYALIASLLGARAGYALRFLDVYMQEPLSLISLNPSTLSRMDGVLTAVLVASVYGQRQRLPLWSTLDALTPALALFMIFLGLSHLSSGDAFGRETTVPWAIELWGALRHPSQAYETIAQILVFSAVLLWRKSAPFSGYTFLLWVAAEACAVLFLEAFRGDSVLLFGTLRRTQLVALAFLVSALNFLHRRAAAKLRSGAAPARN